MYMSTGLGPRAPWCSPFPEKLSKEGLSGSSIAGVRSTALEATRLVGLRLLKGRPNKAREADALEDPKAALSLGSCNLPLGCF